MSTTNTSTNTNMIGKAHAKDTTAMWERMLQQMLERKENARLNQESDICPVCCEGILNDNGQCTDDGCMIGSDMLDH